MVASFNCIVQQAFCMKAGHDQPKFRHAQGDKVHLAQLKPDHDCDKNK